MFERFTPGSRRVVVAAQDLCRQRHDTAIGAEHLLLALLDEPEALSLLGSSWDPERVRAALDVAPPADLDPDALASVGVDLSEVRRRVEASFGPGALDAPPAPPATGWWGRRRRARDRAYLPFTAEAKRALEHSLAEALRLGDQHIGVEHLLLALLHPDGLTARATVSRSGVDPDLLARDVRDRLGGGGPG